VRDTLVVGRQGLTIFAVPATEGSWNTRRWPRGERIIFFQDEGFSIVGLSAHSGALERTSVSSRDASLDALALLANDVVFILTIVALGVLVVLIFSAIGNGAQGLRTIQLEVIVLELQFISLVVYSTSNHVPLP
jgi:hypothetical protein